MAEDWIPAYEEYLSQYGPDEKLFPRSPRRLEYLLEDIGNGQEKYEVTRDELIALVDEALRARGVV